MSDVEEAREMFAMARKDFDAIKAMVGQPAFADEIFGFHAQQAVEKAFKAWLSLIGCEYPVTHNLSALLAMLEERGCDVQRFRDLAKYNSFAVQFRYEQAEGLKLDMDRERIVREVTAVVGHVEGLISP